MTPVVLSGGSGTRLWPLSRSQYPKQFCELMTDSLLGQTLRRLSVFGSPWVLTLSELGHLTRRVFSERSLSTDRILMEPAARNTAPAIALLCRYFELKGFTEDVIGVFPADHLIENEAAFHQAVARAVEAAQSDSIVTLGIQPTSAATGFGYIETDSSKEQGQQTGAKAQAKPRLEPTSSPDAGICKVLSFREKPDLLTAEAYLQSGRFFWNAGIFIFKLSTMIKAFQEYAPEVWRPLLALRPDLSNVNEIYQKLPSISIDYAVMERAKDQICVPCDMGWSDLGSWDDVADFDERRTRAKDSPQLRNRAHIINVESQNCFGLSNEEKVIGFVDLHNVIAIDTPDALLLMNRNSSQKVREVVAQLARHKSKSLHEHQFEVRPWGRFEVLRDEAHYKLKKITVDPKAQISYQSHSLRAEHWFVVAGEGEVILNDEVIRVERGSAIFIPTLAKHRIRNTGLSSLEFIEVQTGRYFGEDDIVRYQDDYSRR